AEADADPAAEVDRRLHQHATELAEVGRPEAHGKPAAGPVDLDPQAELTVEVVLAGDGVAGDAVVEVGLMLRHPPDALAALDRDLAADRQIPHVLAEPEALLEDEREEERSGPGPGGATEG